MTAKMGFGDRIKMLEMAEAGRVALPRLPVLARLDGRAFHTFTRGFDRPFDPAMSAAMIATAKALVEEFDAACAYTQSDEITLAWLEPNIFDGRFQKLTSVVAGYTSVVFAAEIRERKSHLGKQVPCFDCRVWQVPTLQDVIDVFVWREDDATKNSITMAAQAYYSHKDLHGVDSAAKHELLFRKGVNWNDFPAHFRRGVYLKRVLEDRPLTEQEWLRIPEKKRPARDLLVRRSKVDVLDMPPIRKYLEADRVLLGVKLPEVEVPRYEVLAASPLRYGKKAEVVLKTKKKAG
jgi:tRNA(His) 5'-end guanylyltransferase